MNKQVRGYCWLVLMAMSPLSMAEDSAPRLAQVATVEGSPVAIRHAGDTSGRLFIVSRDGSIRVLETEQPAQKPRLFLDIRKRVRSGGETGLLGLAFDPEYKTNGFFYVNYTATVKGSLRTRISRFRVLPDQPDKADPTSEDILLEIRQPYSNHNGGDIHFGPDGYLYIATGDGGSGGDPEDRARHRNNLLGKLLRIDVHGRKSPQKTCGLVGRYSIPADNPFVNETGSCPEIWAYGLRNPWRFSFDRSTGDLFIADVGQNKWEEVNFQPATSKGGENYGWSCREGTHPFNEKRCDGSPLVTPILEYGHDQGCSITGGYRYRGPETELQGTYVYADFCSGRIWFARQNKDGWSAHQALTTRLNISSFGEDEVGNLYIAHLGGAIYRLETKSENKHNSLK